MRERDADDHAAHVLERVVRRNAARREEDSLRDRVSLRPLCARNVVMDQVTCWHKHAEGSWTAAGIHVLMLNNALRCTRRSLTLEPHLRDGATGVAAGADEAADQAERSLADERHDGEERSGGSLVI